MTMKSTRGTWVRPQSIDLGASRAVVTPLMPSVVYASENPDTLDAQYGGTLTGYTYAREGHPNADILAARIDAMEGAPQSGLILSSGMGAVTTVLLGLLKAGDHVIGSDQLYGRSLRVMREDLPRLGIATTLVDTRDAGNVAKALRAETRMILVEAVSNPTLSVADIEGIAKIAAHHGASFVIDNTFTTPRAFRPFDFGADVVVHSVTKLLAGHADVTLGYVAAKDADMAARLRTFAVTAGFTPSPFDCWLAERGLLSFDLRYDRAEATAGQVADALAGHGGVKRVLYPSRSDHPDHARAGVLLGGRGCNMVSFEIEGGRTAANAFTAAASDLAFAPTLGDVGTTISHPASSSHRGLSPAQRAEMGLSEGFFRLSIGLEDPDALCGILTSALDGI